MHVMAVVVVVVMHLMVCSLPVVLLWLPHELLVTSLLNRFVLNYCTMVIPELGPKSLHHGFKFADGRP